MEFEEEYKDQADRFEEYENRILESEHDERIFCNKPHKYLYYYLIKYKNKILGVGDRRCVPHELIGQIEVTRVPLLLEQNFVRDFINIFKIKYEENSMKISSIENCKDRLLNEDDNYNLYDYATDIEEFYNKQKTYIPHTYLCYTNNIGDAIEYANKLRAKDLGINKEEN